MNDILGPPEQGVKMPPESNYRLWWEQAERRRVEVERVLDGVLGTEEGDGAEAGLVADVVMALAVAWDQGASANAENYARLLYDDGEPITNPYRATPPDAAGA